MDNQAAGPQPDAVDSPPVSDQPKEPYAGYTIYLLTVWFDSTENASNPSNWRFRLENPRTKEAKGFVGVAALATGVSKMVAESIRWHTESPKAPE